MSSAEVFTSSWHDVALSLTLTLTLTLSRWEMGQLLNEFLKFVTPAAKFRRDDVLSAVCERLAVICSTNDRQK